MPKKPPYRVRRSKVHGLGGFATKAIRKGDKVAEYTGERISHQEANKRYDSKSALDSHTFLFTVDRHTVIDGGVNGGDVRFINHSCDPNLESTIERRRVYLYAIRGVKKGEELFFDYQIGRDKTDPPDVDEIFACRCGAKECRGTMLWPAKRPEPRKPKTKVKSKAKAKSKVKARSKRGAAAQQKAAGRR
jgi:SET domain-containing protein